MSIPWLHVIREHSFFLKNYEKLFTTSTGVHRVIKDTVKKTRIFIGWLSQILKALRSDGVPWHASKALSGQVDVLFVSHLLSESDAGKAHDFYFGSLPELLQAQGRRVVVALIDHSGASGMGDVQCWDEAGAPRVLLSTTLDLRGELSLYLRLRKESSRLAAVSRREAPGFLMKVFSFAALEAMSGGARTTLRMSVQISSLIKATNPKMLVVTYEGHAWERVVFASARDTSAAMQCVGYQHSAVFRLQHAALRKLGSPFDPDLVLTAGSVSKVQIESSLRLKDIPVRILGSHRAPVDVTNSHDINLESDRKGTSIDAERRETCLVLPEGIISECLLLFEFSLNCAKLMPEMRFIWRLHPLVNQENLMQESPQLRKLPENVEFSKELLEDDLKRAGYALYRGSTAIVKAAYSGVHPIYLAQACEMTIDPLYELDGVVAKVDSPSGFQATIRNKNVVSDAFARDQQRITHYCEGFYSAVDAEVILSMLP